MNEAKIRLIIEALLKDKGLIDAKAKVGDLEKQVAGLRGKLDAASAASKSLMDGLARGLGGAALAAFVRLDRFDPQPFQLQGRTQQLGLGEQRQQQVALAHRRGLGQYLAHRLDVAACGRRGGRQHRLLVGPAQAHRVAAPQSCQFAGGTLAVVLQ